jgi:hypothetical protein
MSQEYLVEEEIPVATAVLRTWMRCLLVLMAVALIAVFGIAWWLQPYRDDGAALTSGSHQQLGLPPCTFKELTGRPCPSCGMTTSFALFVRGDLLHSMQANFAGTILAAFCLLTIPWALACAFRGQYYWIASLEWFVPRFIVVFFGVMLLRWGVVLLFF